MWHIGQDIVCIKSHSQGAVKEGEVFTIKGLRKNCCAIEINIGMSMPMGVILNCRHCGSNKHSDGVYWLRENLFAPLEADLSEIYEYLNMVEV